jgi:hypothetical protein
LDNIGPLVDGRRLPTKERKKDFPKNAKILTLPVLTRVGLYGRYVSGLTPSKKFGELQKFTTPSRMVVQ